MNDNQINLFVSIPKSDYDDLMKFKDGLVQTHINIPLGNWGMVITHSEFTTIEGINMQMSKEIERLKTRIENAEAIILKHDNRGLLKRIFGSKNK